MISVAREIRSAGPLSGLIAKYTATPATTKPVHTRTARPASSAEPPIGVSTALNRCWSVGVNALSEVGEGVALGYLDGRIAYANRALAELAKLPQEQIRSLNFFELLDYFRTDVFDEPAIAVRRVLQTGEAYERELHFADRNATYGLRISLVLDSARVANGAEPRSLEGAMSADAGALADARGSAGPLCLALVVKDLTLLKEYDHLKSDMISLMSHELRTPLTSINGFAELLTTDDTLPEQAKEFVTIIANESQRMSNMINTFLAVTKLQRKDRQEVLKIPLRLDEVVRETILSMQSVAKKRRIRLVEQPTARLPPVARKVRAIEPLTDAKGATFVTFAVDELRGSTTREAFTGCAYLAEGHVYVQKGEAYFPAALLLGKDVVEADAHLCRAAEQRAALK